MKTLTILLLAVLLVSAVSARSFHAGKDITFVPKLNVEISRGSSLLCCDLWIIKFTTMKVESVSLKNIVPIVPG